MDIWTRNLHCVTFQKESFRMSLEFESKLLQRFRTSIKSFQSVGNGNRSFRRCQISNKISRKKIDFEQNVTTRQISNQMLWNWWAFKWENLQYVNFYRESFTKFLQFESKILQSVRISSRSLQHVRFRIKILTTCSIWDKKTKHVGT